MTHLRSTPPSREALRHSGGESLRCTSPTVTLYLEVELSRDRRPGTEQNTSFTLTVTPPISPSLLIIRDVTLLCGIGTAGWREQGGGEKKPHEPPFKMQELYSNNQILTSDRHYNNNKLNNDKDFIDLFILNFIKNHSWSFYT